MTVNKDGGRLPKSVDICVCCQGSAGRKIMEVMVWVTAVFKHRGQQNQSMDRKTHTMCQALCKVHNTLCVPCFIILILAAAVLCSLMRYHML